MGLLRMRFDHALWRWLFLAGVALAAAPAMLSAQQVEEGDTLHIRLLDDARSHHHARPAVRAVVIAPLAAPGGRIVIPPGSVVSGRVAGSGTERFEGKRRWLELDLDSIAVPLVNAASDTVHAELPMRIAVVDDARESVDSAGRIVGPKIPSLLKSKRDWAVMLLGFLHPAGALVLGATLEGE